MRRENGITLIALIITIIILVILAAVSVSAVLNMKIVDYAVSGSQGYAQAGKDEEKMLDETSNTIDDTVTKIKNIQGSTSTSKDESTTIETALNNNSLTFTNGTATLGGKTISDLGPGANVGEEYYLYDGTVYKAVWAEVTGALTEVTSVEVASVDAPVILATQLPSFECTVTKTNIDASKLGLQGTSFTTINGTYTEGQYTVVDGEPGYYVVNGYQYTSTGVCLGEDNSVK